MAMHFSFGSERVPANNRQAASLLELALKVGQESCREPAEQEHANRLKRLLEEDFYPGRDVDIDVDFPGVSERKFWSRIFYDTARAIFERRVGHHEHAFWQSQRIWQAYGVAGLFERSVQAVEPKWSAPSRDREEFEHVVNSRPPTDR